MGYSPVLQSSCLKRESIQLCKCYTNVKGNTISEKLHHSDIYFLSMTGKTTNNFSEAPTTLQHSCYVCPVHKRKLRTFTKFLQLLFFFTLYAAANFRGYPCCEKMKQKKPQLPSFKRHTQNLTLPYSHTINYELCNFF